MEHIAQDAVVRPTSKARQKRADAPVLLEQDKALAKVDHVCVDQ